MAEHRSHPSERAPTTNDRGRAAEERAARLLEASGLRVVARNVVSGGVELDLVAETTDGGEPTLVFVEVRSRHHAEQGDPLATISANKAHRLVRGATAYLVERELWGRVAVRFDVVGVVGDVDGAGEHDVTWIRSAFEAG